MNYKKIIFFQPYLETSNVLCDEIKFALIKIYNSKYSEMLKFSQAFSTHAWAHLSA